MNHSSAGVALLSPAQFSLAVSSVQLASWLMSHVEYRCNDMRAGFRVRVVDDLQEGPWKDVVDLREMSVPGGRVVGAGVPDIH